METLLINLKSEEDKALFLSLARRLRLKTKSISESDKEDFGLLKAMLEAETGENVSREEIMKALQSWSCDSIVWQIFSAGYSQNQWQQAQT